VERPAQKTGGFGVFGRTLEGGAELVGSLFVLPELPQRVAVVEPVIGIALIAFERFQKTGRRGRVVPPRERRRQIVRTSFSGTSSLTIRNRRTAAS